MLLISDESCPHLIKSFLSLLFFCLDSMYILKTFIWSLHVEVVVDTKKPPGQRARLVGIGKRYLHYLPAFTALQVNNTCTSNTSLTGKI